MKLIEATDRAAWDKFVDSHADGHPLQLWGWGELKRLNGWQPIRLWDEARNEGAQMLLWRIPKTKMSLAYIPRGPLGRSKSLLAELSLHAKERNAVYLRIEPAWAPDNHPRGWVKSRDHILLPQTYSIDLGKTEAELLDAMRHKTRQYIRKSEKDGVKIGAKGPEAFDDFWRIYSDTARRAKFALHDRKYYERLWAEAGEHNLVLFAQVDGVAVAFLWLIFAGGVAFELYGGIDEKGAEVRANYALKWEAIRRMKQAGGRLYDFNGRLNDGVGQFKAGFGPDETEWVGTLDMPLKPLFYRGWRMAWPVGKRAARMIGGHRD